MWADSGEYLGGAGREENAVEVLPRNEEFSQMVASQGDRFCFPGPLLAYFLLSALHFVPQLLAGWFSGVRGQGWLLFIPPTSSSRHLRGHLRDASLKARKGLGTRKAI